MAFEINSEKEIDKIKSFLSITIREDDNRSTDEKIYKEMRSVADEKVDLIAHEMHLIMNSKNHPYNFLPDNEAWEMYRDSALKGATMLQGFLEEQLYLLAHKVSCKLDAHYIKAITYFYGDAVNCHNYSEDYELVIDWLPTDIEWSALNEIQGVLVNIAEKEQELEWEQLAELEKEEEIKECVIDLYSDIEILTKKQAVKQENIEQINSCKCIQNNEKSNILKVEHYKLSVIKELVSIIEYQEEKLESYDELVEIKEEESITPESSTQLVDLKKLISKEKSRLKILKKQQEDELNIVAKAINVLCLFSHKHCNKRNFLSWV